MSSRQMRRLQDLVDRATGLDADEPESDEDRPSTMQPKRPDHHHHHKKKTKKDKKESTDAAPASGSLAPPQPPKPLATQPSTSPSAVPVEKRSTTQPIARPPPAAAAAASSAADDWEEVSDEGADNTSTKKAQAKKAQAEEDEAAAAAAAEEERQRKKAEKKKARQQQQRQRQAEEDALLDAVLARREHELVSDGAGSGAGRAVAGSFVGDGGSGGVAAASYAAGPVPSASPTVASPSSAGPAGAGDASFLHLVMACDAAQLDTRLERIRMFGSEAVEDVGDGRTPHRRADGRVRDTGSTSFFPPHHTSVKFVQSAFATPNRHRWIPYDGLGIYLTTEEVHGAWRQAWREYQLDCSSNAFRRAQASLESCQGRMGGVQELVDCLARNRVYHIPTLLQCVYTMEATGESAFAAELLDVALYQVGVLLRRFAISGTWDRRQLPYHKGANTLLFQVLQRGVHAALRRGCLRTAFERARCLLSLDSSDPYGMLLLLDYAALRAKRWVWLLEVRHRAVAVLAHLDQAFRTANANDGDAHDMEATLAASGLTALDVSLSEELLWLPTYAFSCALAKHFIEREEARQETGATEKSSAPARPSKVLRGITEAQRAALAATPPAVELLEVAVRRFPQAATRLVEALGGVEAVCGGDASAVLLLGAAGGQTSAWQRLVEQAQADGDGDETDVRATLADLFVARHEELWKLNECVGLLRQVVQRLAAEPADSGTAAKEADDAMPQHVTLALDRYHRMSRDAVMGASVAPIPADLLEPDAAEAAEFDLDAGDGVAPRVERLVELLQNTLDVFGENEYIRHLMDEVHRQFRHRLEGHADAAATGADAEVGDAAGGSAEGERQWYDVDESDDDDEMAAQEWFSVASGESRDEEDPAEGDEGAPRN